MIQFGRSASTAIVFPLLMAGLLLMAAPALGHGELHGQLEETTRNLEAELRKPVDGHERAKFYLERAELYRLHGDWARAEADYAQSERYEPDNDMVWLCRAKMLLESGAPERARVELDRFLASNVDHPDALLTQARALAKLGWGVGAIRFLDRALARHPQPEPDHYLARVDVLVSLGDAHLDRAIRGLDQGIRRLGPVVTLDEQAIELELKLKRYDHALARARRQTRLSVRKDVWLARQADILALAGRPQRAHRARAQALQALTALPVTLQSRPSTAALKQRLLADNAR